MSLIVRTNCAIVLPVCAMLAGAIADASAQSTRQAALPDAVAGRLESLERDTSSLIGRMFGQAAPASPEQAPVTLAQVSAPELTLRLDRIESELRQLTGAIEQLQNRNYQLEQQLRRAQEEADNRFQELGAKPIARPGAPTAPQPSGAPVPPPATQGAPPRRSDVFDPNQNPTAPGAPRTLGSVPVVAGQSRGEAVTEPAPAEPPYVGVPGGRPAGAPLDLSTIAVPGNEETATVPAAPPTMSGQLPPPPPRNPSATGAQQVMAPSATPRDEYDLAYGYVLRKDYALAEDSLRGFLKKYPGDRLVPDAYYWLGEVLFQRQRYADAAQVFLTVSTKYETAARAPEALLRLGQSLAAINEKEAACSTLAEIGRKYPRAAVTVKQSAEREQKRVHC